MGTEPGEALYCSRADVWTTLADEVAEPGTTPRQCFYAVLCHVAAP